MIYLHIGLHKVGSSTIQRFAAARASVLAAHGVHYPESGRGQSDAHHQLVAAMRDPDSGTAVADVAALVASRPDDTFLFSSEGLSTLRPPLIRQLVAPLRRQHDVRVLLYIRNAVDTTVSAYNQTAKRGQRLASFDAFYETRANGREALDHVRHWGEMVGYDAMRVRSIEPTALAGGDLLTDLCRAVGLDDTAIADLDPASVRSTNTRVPWEAAEYAREFARRSAALLEPLDAASRDALLRGGGPPRRIARSIGPDGTYVDTLRIGDLTDLCIEATLAAGGGKPAQYLTPEQSAHLDARYREQLAEIATLVPDAKLDHVAPKSLPPRPFEPSYAEISPEVKAAIAAAVEQRLGLDQLPAPLRDLFRAMHGKVPDTAESTGARQRPGITDPAERERRRQRRAAKAARAG